MVDINAYGQQFLKDYINDDFEVTLTKYRKKKLIELCGCYNTTSMLEIGCGMEPFFLEYNNFENMTIVEPAQIMYEAAMAQISERNQDSTKRIECIHGFLEENVDELRKNIYDMILLVGLIHEVENPDNLIESIKTLCNEKTKIIVTSNNPKSFHLTLAYESGIIPVLGGLSEKAKNFQRKKVFFMKDMEDLLENNGFEIIESGSYFIKPFSHAQMKQIIDSSIIKKEVLDGLYNMVKYMPDLGAENYCIVKLPNKF